ncbi:tetratricopeptide repeat protein [Geotalea uraniireducens]|nr:hypothetical protein [Geotalea uraniireducens]
MDMLFNKLFQKNYRYYMEQGDKFLQEGRFADAKYSYGEAIDKIDTTNDAGKADMLRLQNKIIIVNDGLADLNLLEAEHAINCNDRSKAEDHLLLVMELAEDVTIREKAGKLLENLTVQNHSTNLINNNNGCFGCKSSAEELSENSHVSDDQLSMEDRFELLIHTLPAPLPERYAALGKKFACAYLLIHDGDDVKALQILEELLSENENDILLYEAALIKYRCGEIIDCERFLRQAISINPSNSLCYLGLVQLLIDSDRLHEVIPVLNHMIEFGLLSDQALVLLGDVYVMIGDDLKAIDNFSKALSSPGVARGAAEKLVSLLKKHDRVEEAAYISKRYLKACC